MSDIKIMFTDIDGTLLPFNQPNVPDTTLESLQKLRAQGVKVIVATGKSLKQMLDTSVGKIPFDPL